MPGALGGTPALALGESAEAVIEAATEYTVDRNGAGSAELTIGHNDDDPYDEGETVAVVARKSLPTFFSRVIGWSTLQAGAQATASYAPVGAMTGGVLPIAVDLQYFEYGLSYHILAGGGPGNFGSLGWDGCTDAPCLLQNLPDEDRSADYVNPYDPNLDKPEPRGF